MEKKVLFLVYKQSKAQSYCLPPKTKRSTDSRPKTATRESKVSTYREVLEEYVLKKREKK